MKLLSVEKWHHAIFSVEMCVIMTVCAVACCPEKPDAERVEQNDMQCRAVVQTQWGDGPGELGYVPNDQSTPCLHIPSRFQVDEAGGIYVADTLNTRILEFSTAGKLVKSFDVPIPTAGNCIVDLAVRGNRIVVATRDDVYVFDENDDSVKVLHPPKEAGACAMSGEGKSVQIDGEGNVYTCVLGLGWEGPGPGGTVLQFDREGSSHEFFVGQFDHVIVGWDGTVHIQQLYCGEGSMEGSGSHYEDDCVVKLDSEGNQVDKVIIRGSNLADAGLSHSGLLIGVDTRGNLYGSTVSGMKEGTLVSKSAFVQVDSQGEIVRVIERDISPLVDTTVVDKEGNLYWFRFGEIPSEPAEIWSCKPGK